jgi:hypothetical protein
MLLQSPPVRLLSCALAAAAMACGHLASESIAPPPEVIPDAAGTVDAPAPVHPPPATSADAAPSVGDAAASPSQCSVQVTGSVDVSWQGGEVMADLETGGSGSNHLYILCPYRSGPVEYVVSIGLDGVVAGSGTYAATHIVLFRNCVAGTCPGDWSFFAAPPAATCTVQVTDFEAQARGGMAATFDCPSLPIDDLGNSSDPSTIHLAGSLTLPAVVAGAPPPPGDAGGVAPVDAGAPNCSMQVGGAYTAVQTDGVGWAQADLPEDAGVPAPDGTVACTIVVDGVTYGLSVGFGPDGHNALLTVTGASWCTTGCTVSFVGPCDRTVTADAAADSPFDATFTCNDLAFPAGPGVSGQPVSVTGKFHGLLSPARPPPG